jgi:hypothetical protein
MTKRLDNSVPALRGDDSQRMVDCQQTLRPSSKIGAVFSDSQNDMSAARELDDGRVQCVDNFGFLSEHSGIVDDIPAHNGENGSDLLETLIRHSEVIVAENCDIREFAGFDAAHLIFFA